MSTSPPSLTPSSTLSPGTKGFLGKLGESFNRPLDEKDRDRLAPVTEELRAIAPDMMARKIPDAVFQQAFCYDTVRRLTVLGDRVPNVLVIGGYEDPVAWALAHNDYDVLAVDPSFSADQEHKADEPRTQAIRVQDIVYAVDFPGYDFVVCCSAIEHDGDDKELVQRVCKLLRPGGVAVFTMDFRKDWKDGDQKPEECQRIYSAERLVELSLVVTNNGCELVGSSGYYTHEVNNYFSYGGVDYAFAAMVFCKP